MKSGKSRRHPNDSMQSFDLMTEFSRTISDIAGGLDPRTVTHALLQASGRPTSREDVLAITGLPEHYIDRTLAALAVEGFLSTVSENGFEKHSLLGPLK
jgi:hypothetical protein